MSKNTPLYTSHLALGGVNSLRGGEGEDYENGMPDLEDAQGRALSGPYVHNFSSILTVALSGIAIDSVIASLDRPGTLRRRTMLKSVRCVSRKATRVSWPGHGSKTRSPLPTVARVASNNQPRGFEAGRSR